MNPAIVVGVVSGESYDHVRAVLTEFVDVELAARLGLDDVFLCRFVESPQP